ncbi:hypothetical protein HDU98_009899 [Podochytrium sp. JEL0797]|nr:hypothetical protein HDU98_009899 [Podochytrium sp. JEL0797]
MLDYPPAILTLLQNRIETLEARVIAQSQQIIVLRKMVKLLESDDESLAHAAIPSLRTPPSSSHDPIEPDEILHLSPTTPATTSNPTVLVKFEPQAPPVSQPIESCTKSAIVMHEKHAGTTPPKHSIICESFNRRSFCLAQSCPDLHICLACGGEHRLIGCELYTGVLIKYCHRFNAAGCTSLECLRLHFCMRCKRGDHGSFQCLPPTPHVTQPAPPPTITPQPAPPARSRSAETITTVTTKPVRSPHAQACTNFNLDKCMGCTNEHECLICGGLDHGAVKCRMFRDGLKDYCMRFNTKPDNCKPRSGNRCTFSHRCFKCASADHGSFHCPHIGSTLITRAPRDSHPVSTTLVKKRSRSPSPARKADTPAASPLHPPTHDRTKTRTTSTAVCFNFSSFRSCKFPQCTYTHTCLICQGAHSVKECRAWDSSYSQFCIPWNSSDEKCLKAAACRYLHACFRCKRKGCASFECTHA